ncbi:Hydroxylysine kinase [Clonorchis sinensis]|uniref:Hydroxylysine kinase n=1 Tax=Clonorchis sinensis TaxID=79923 RepID=A0A3R7CH42_CLOSI|nr:Hydroxylysine kinase [Clonorchis sinensis]
MSNVKPFVQVEDVRNIVENYYGIVAQQVDELVSYDDRNFRIQTKGEPGTASNEDTIYLLKISGFLEQKSEEILAIHNGIMQHLHEQGLLVQRPLLSVNKRTVETIELPTFHSDPVHRRCHTMRMLIYIPGQTWSSLTPLQPEVYFEMGRFLAKLQKHLREHYSTWKKPVEEHIWTLSNASQALQYLDTIEDNQKRQLGQQVLNHFVSQYAKRLPVTAWTPGIQDVEFPISLIHGDPNDLNIIMRKIPRIDSTEEKFEFGILDWEDCSVSRRIYDLALMLMYAMCTEGPCCATRLAKLGAAIIRGFNSEARDYGMPITGAESQALPALVAARFAQSLIKGHYTSFVSNPGDQYALTTAKQGGWEKLQSLWIDDKEIYSTEWEKATC